MLSTLKKAQQPLIWWLLAAGTAAALKWHFSAADSASLAWMLRPLALSLQWLMARRFEQTAAGDWACAAAGIVLVKACAGINFMIMSFLGWCLWLQPRACGPAASVPATAPAAPSCSPRSPWLRWPILIAGALTLAWLVALGVNALRVLAIVAWQPKLEHWLAPAVAHRLIGLGVYLSALILQLTLADSGRPPRPARAAWIAAALYLAVMLLVPMLSGHAGANTRQFREHLVMVLTVTVPLAVASLLMRRTGVH